LVVIALIEDVAIVKSPQCTHDELHGHPAFFDKRAIAL